MGKRRSAVVGVLAKPQLKVGELITVRFDQVVFDLDGLCALTKHERERTHSGGR